MADGSCGTSRDVRRTGRNRFAWRLRFNSCSSPARAGWRGG